METDPRYDENDLMDGQDIPLGHKKFLLMRSELLKMIRTRELTRTRSHQLLAMLSEACDANFTRGYQCGLDDSEEEIKRLKEGYEGSCYACEPVGMKNLELENEIRRLREERDEAVALKNACLTTIGNMTEENLRLRDERDEARREVCWIMQKTGFMRGDYANSRGWDCFKDPEGPCPDAVSTFWDVIENDEKMWVDKVDQQRKVLDWVLPQLFQQVYPEYDLGHPPMYVMSIAIKKPDEGISKDMWDIILKCLKAKP